RPCLRNRRGLFERHAFWLSCECAFGGAHILRKPTKPAAAQITKHCIPRSESSYFTPDVFHYSRHVASNDLLRSKETPDDPIHALALNEPQIPIVDGYGVDPDQDFVLLRGRFFDFSNFQDF